MRRTVPEKRKDYSVIQGRFSPREIKPEVASDRERIRGQTTIIFEGLENKCGAFGERGHAGTVPDDDCGMWPGACWKINSVVQTCVGASEHPLVGRCDRSADCCSIVGRCSAARSPAAHPFQPGEGLR